MFKLIHINGCDLICYDNGDVWRWNLTQKKWKKFVSKSKGYWRININGKYYSVHRLIANAFLGLDLDSELVIDHINHDIHNNSVANLRVVTIQQNGFNRHAKGYTKKNYTKKDKGKYASIDHKKSVYFGFINNLPIEEIACLDNLCITKISLNSQKGRLNENEYKEKYNK